MHNSLLYCEFFELLILKYYPKIAKEFPPQSSFDVYHSRMTGYKNYSVINSLLGKKADHLMSEALKFKRKETVARLLGLPHPFVDRDTFNLEIQEPLPKLIRKRKK